MKQFLKSFFWSEIELYNFFREALPAIKKAWRKFQSLPLDDKQRVFLRFVIWFFLMLSMTCAVASVVEGLS